MRQHIQVWHLEITDASLIPAATEERLYELSEAIDPTPEFARFLYLSVGAPWTWYMRLRWRHSQWAERFRAATVRLFVAYRDACPVGYFELELQPRRSVEICYFGLIPEVIGTGLGKSLLEDALRTAWSMGGSRIWLHTCSLDHPHALDNYKTRGFTVFKEEQVVDDVPDSPLEPWLGARKPAQKPGHKSPHTKKGRPKERP